ncbi:helix-turn-helix domain-containing protein [Aquimarina celericrescens]|uniref:Helix-turn-helix domain-containing protein n=1 Tax=Aquimarina celericrescens TaxID=1964542 RepID=A0ABW5AS56_9FLAO|nr:helix-turn-helix transcriptional regulator [Aquimarina celericrescens]
MKILTKGNYYGTQRSELSFNGIVVSKYHYTEPQTAWHYHENPYFMYVLQGNMIDGNARTKTLCPIGSLMYNNWQEVHYGVKESKEASGFHLEFERDWLKQKGIDHHVLEGSQLIEDPQIHVLFGKLYSELMFPDPDNEISVELLVLQICDRLSHRKEMETTGTPGWISSLKELLHYDSNDLTLQYLSDQLQVHPVHISRAVPKYLSSSLGEYMRQQRLKKAIPFLLDPNFSLTEVAYIAGFYDQSHFHRVFKEYFRMTPSMYRKRILKNGIC